MKKFFCVLMTVIGIMGLCTFADTVDQPSSWALKEVNRAVEIGLVPENLQSHYKNNISRSEFAELIMALQGVWDQEGKTSSIGETLVQAKVTVDSDMFSDTSAESVLNCAAMGILEGDGKGHFMPNDFLTRQQAAKIIYKTCDVFNNTLIIEDFNNSTSWKGVASYELPHLFKDGTAIRSYARTPIQWCYRHSFMFGTSEELFSPNGTLTREQAIITLLRVYYSNGSADLMEVKSGLDYYPIFDLWGNVVSWIDSKLDAHTLSEVGYLEDRQAKVGFVVDNTAAGPIFGRLINQKGETLLTDLWKMDGVFRDAEVEYPYVYLVNRFDIPLPKGTPSMGVVNLETGQVWIEKSLLDILGNNYSKIVEQANIRVTPKGKVTLNANDGALLSKEYDSLFNIEGNLYVGASSHSTITVDIIYCDKKHQATVLRKETLLNRPEVIKLGSGVYAVQNSLNKITLFDAFGDLVNVVNTEESVSLIGSSNGLLWLQVSGTEEDIYYTQSGKSLGMIQ